MWFQLGVQNLLAKKNLIEDSCDVFITDFLHIWHKSLSNNELLSISQTMNPLLEVSAQKLKDITLNLLEDVKVYKEVKEENKNLSLKIKSSILGVKFQFQVLLKLGDADMLYKELTIPLLVMLMNTQSREKKLLKIIKDKDSEIKDYKQEYGARLKYLETKPFDLIDFNKELATSISVDPILECISAKLGSLEAMPIAKQKEMLEDESEKLPSSSKCDTKKTVFTDRCLNSTGGSRPFLFLDNQTIKKMRKHNEGCKIKI